MASAVHVLPLGRLRMRAFMKRVLSLHFSPLCDLCRSVTVTCSAGALEECGVFTLMGPTGSIMLRKVETTDASLTGWGTIQESRTLNCVWPSTLYSAHLNYLELLTVWKSEKCSALPARTSRAGALWQHHSHMNLQGGCAPSSFMHSSQAVSMKQAALSVT